MAGKRGSLSSRDKRPPVQHDRGPSLRTAGDDDQAPYDMREHMPNPVTSPHWEQLERINRAGHELPSAPSMDLMSLVQAVLASSLPEPGPMGPFPVDEDLREGMWNGGYEAPVEGDWRDYERDDMPLWQEDMNFGAMLAQAMPDFGREMRPDTFPGQDPWGDMGGHERGYGYDPEDMWRAQLVPPDPQPGDPSLNFGAMLAEALTGQAHVGSTPTPGLPGSRPLQNPMQPGWARPAIEGPGWNVPEPLQPGEEGYDQPGGPVANSLPSNLMELMQTPGFKAGAVGTGGLGLLYLLSQLPAETVEALMGVTPGGIYEDAPWQQGGIPA